MDFLNGPWSNDACVGYAVMALRNARLDKNTILKVVTAMWRCFDDHSVEEAAEYYRQWPG